MRYYIIRNSLTLKHQFTVGMLLSDLSNAIITIKRNFPKQGKILEYMYIGRGNPNINDFKVNQKYDVELRMIDCIISSIFSNSSDCRKQLINESKDISNFFHISSSIFEYYYFIACLLYVFESNYDKTIDITIFKPEQLIEIKKCIEQMMQQIDGLVEIKA